MRVPALSSQISVPTGTANSDIGTALSMFLAARAIAATTCFINTVVSETQESAYIPIASCIDVSTVAAIPAVWPTVRHKLLPTAANSPIPPTAANDSYLSLINHEYLKSIATGVGNAVDNRDYQLTVRAVLMRLAWILALC